MADQTAGRPRTSEEITEGQRNNFAALFLNAERDKAMLTDALDASHRRIAELEAALAAAQEGGAEIIDFESAEYVA